MTATARMTIDALHVVPVIVWWPQRARNYVARIGGGKPIDCLLGRIQVPQVQQMMIIIINYIYV